MFNIGIARALHEARTHHSKHRWTDRRAAV